MIKCSRVSSAKLILFLLLALLIFSGNLGLVASDQQEVDNLIKQGKDFYENGDYDRSTLKFLEALNQAPTQQQKADIHFNLALSYFASAQSEKMKGHLEKLFMIQPNRTIDMMMFPPDFVEVFFAMKHNPSLKAKTAIPEKQPASISEKETVQAAFQVWTDPTTGMEFIWIPGGRFTMGSNFQPDELPVHAVTVDGFWMGKYEVTLKVWRQIMKSFPPYYFQGNDQKYFIEAKSAQDSTPANGVSWNEAQSFIINLNEKGDAKFRLPTEAEWEYACRAGRVDNLFRDLGQFAWYDKTSQGHLHAVGQLSQNEFGLFDILGNVWEWCQDWKSKYADGLQNNPQGPPLANERVYRGGGFRNMAERVRPSYRNSAAPNQRMEDVGFRLVRIK